MSMTELASRAGLAQASISFIERRMRNPTLESLLRIAAVLEVDLGEIISSASSEVFAKRQQPTQGKSAR